MMQLKVRDAWAFGRGFPQTSYNILCAIRNVFEFRERPVQLKIAILCVLSNMLANYMSSSHPRSPPFLTHLSPFASSTSLSSSSP